MKYGKLTVEVAREPVEVAILVDGSQQSGPFVANRERRGLSISDNVNVIRLTADEALELLAWLREQEQALHTMVHEEVAAAAAVERRLTSPHTDAGRDAVQAEPGRYSVEEDLRQQEMHGEIRR